MTAKATAPTQLRIVGALSGRGRTLANLIAAAQAPGARFTIVGVISSSATSGGVAVAEEAGLPLFIGDFSQAHAAATAPRLRSWLHERQATWLTLCGFLKVFPLFPEYDGRVINIHPSLLPAFGGPGMYGERVHKAVLTAGTTETGASVHFVTEHYDEGPVIAQVAVPVEPGDTPASLSARVFQAESALYPLVINEIAAGTLPLTDGRRKRFEYANLRI